MVFALVIMAGQLGKFIKIGIQDCFGQTGTPDELMENYGLSAGRIYERIKYFM